MRSEAFQSRLSSPGLAEELPGVNLPVGLPATTKTSGVKEDKIQIQSGARIPTWNKRKNCTSPGVASDRAMGASINTVDTATMKPNELMTNWWGAIPAELLPPKDRRSRDNARNKRHKK